MTNPTDESMDDLKKRFEDDHQHPVNRLLHKIGVPIIAGGVVTLFFRPAVGASLIGLGYALNFAGHAIEGNVPLLFRDPRAIYLGATHFGKEVLSIFARKPSS